jgi:cation-transporting ATPase E
MQQPQRFTPDAAYGLTARQVRDREEAGLVNAQPPRVSKPLAQILRDNICTFFNALNAGIFVSLLLVKSYANMLFMGVVLSNLLIGVVQELRAKRAVEKLSVLCAPIATVIRDGREEEISTERIVLDDVVCLGPGNQVPTDAVVLSGAAEIDESLLTGESDPQLRQAGDRLLSGSFIVSGSVCARADSVGAQSYAARLAREARRYRRFDSALMLALRRIIRFCGSIVLPLGALLFLRAYFELRHPLQNAVEQAAAAMIGMIPSGLMLLTSISLAAGVIALSRRKTLVQELYCIETLSRVDMLCLDKTGTLTTGNLRVDRVWTPDEAGRAAAEAAIAAFVGALPRDNATARALHERFGGAETAAYGAQLTIAPFSSARRYSAISFEGALLYMGAAQALCPTLSEAFSTEAGHAAREGCRVLLFATAAPVEGGPPPPEQAALTPLALVILLDELRPDAADTLRFFREQDVTVKLISGDDPRTVSAIARRLGLPGHDAYLDASAFSEEALAQAAENHTIFGRVSPRQKRALLMALKAAGHTVAMTGDGVNDVLALKEADCSVALGAGSDAAKQISQLVLLENDFSALPRVVMEGRRVVNNIRRTASLFLVKTIFSFLLTASSVLFSLSYPFQPIQLTLIGALTVGIPSFFLALEPSRARIRGDFLRSVLAHALPGALTIFLYAIIASLAGRRMGLSYPEINTLCVYLAGVAGLCVLLRVCLPLEKLRGILVATMAGLFVAGVLILRGLLELTPGVPLPWLFIALTALCYPALAVLSRIVMRILKQEA